jgi:glycosyltransferase involved in cell wall biosynthesis
MRMPRAIGYCPSAIFAMTPQTNTSFLAASPFPSITIITPIVSDAQHLEATIRSIIYQCYPNLEYIVVEDGTSNERREILQRYRQHFSWQTCPPGTELCATLNMAFAKASGEVLGWLEAGEMLHTNGLHAIGSVFASFPDVEWITGRPFNFSASGLPTGLKHLERWSRIRFLAGGNKYIHRDTTFWRRSLWERAGGSLSTEYGLAGEFDLFVRFFRHARLYSVDALIGGYRTHPGNHSATGSHRRYNQICDEIADRELAEVSGAYAAKLFRRLTRIVSHIPKIRSLWHKYALQSMYRCPGWDWHPRIINRGDKWIFEK